MAVDLCKKIDLAIHVKCTQYDESYSHLIPNTETQKNFRQTT